MAPKNKGKTNNSPSKRAKTSKADPPGKPPVDASSSSSSSVAPAVAPEEEKQPHCYKHDRICYTANRQPPGCRICCYNDECIHPEHDPTHTCNVCNALFHGACQIASWKALDWGTPTELLLCKACDAAARDESEQDAAAPKGAQDEEQKEEVDYVPIPNFCAVNKQQMETTCHCKPFARVRMKSSRHGELANTKDAATTSMTDVV